MLTAPDKEELCMKLHTLTRRITAAALTAAMALSVCAPALAAGQSTAPDTPAAASAAAAPADSAESSTETGTEPAAGVIVFDTFTFDPQEDKTLIFLGDDASGNVTMQYVAADRTLTVTGTMPRALTISAPGVDVVLKGTTGPAVKGDLTISASASVRVTSSADGAQAITGSAAITSDGTVDIIGADRAVGGENLIVNAGGDVTVVGGCAGAAIWHNASITTIGRVTLTTTNPDGWAQGTNGEGILTVDAGGDVTITGGTTSQPTINGATIHCGGDLELRNPTGGLVLYGKSSDGQVGILNYYNTSTTETVFRASSMGDTCSVFQPGSGTMFGTYGDPSWVTAKHEQGYQLTLTNCTTTFTRDSGTFYKDETIYLEQERPLDGTVFTGWTVTTADGTAVPFETTNNGICFTMPASAVSAAANWDTPEDLTGPGLQLTSNLATITVTAASLEEHPEEGVTYENGAFVIDGAKADATFKTLSVLGLAPTADERPDVVLKNLTADVLTVDGVRDVTLDTCRIRELKNHDQLFMDYSLQITNARDVVLTNTSSSYSDLSGVRNVTATTNGILCNRLNIKCTGDIELSTTADTLGVTCWLRAGGSIRLTGAPWERLSVDTAQNVTVDAKALPQHTYLTCSGIVDVTQRDGSAIVKNENNYYYLSYRHETQQPYAVTLNGETSEAQSEPFDLNDLDTLRSIQYLLITPASMLPTDDDADTGDQFITDASGVVVSAALTGAAVWGGYEVVTRVMLHKLLPEDAAIPANRGELALLLWNTAGRPEAGAAVTVYPDIADAELQAAARWCTEQGLLTARKDGTFAPNGWVPKWRVIEVWNNAFAN